MRLTTHFITLKHISLRWALIHTSNIMLKNEYKSNSTPQN